MWGVYETEKEIHIIPLDKKGNTEPPHTIDCFCFCEPICEFIGEDGRLIINHNKEQ